MTAWTIPSYAEWAVPGYTEERLLGHGVSGRVVVAVNEATGQRVAIKYLDEDLVRDPEFLSRLRAEAERLRSLDAAHVVRLFSYVEQPGQGAAIVMELVDGVSLREMITRGGPLGAAAALVVLKDSLLGLAAAHSRRVPHRDLKPDNVLVDTRGRCTLTDFGVSVKADKQMPAAGAPAYMAPELWHGAPNVPATDLYAATAVFFECVTGKPPFSGRPGQPAAPARVRAGAPRPGRPSLARPRRLGHGQEPGGPAAERAGIPRRGDGAGGRRVRAGLGRPGPRETRGARRQAAPAAGERRRRLGDGDPAGPAQDADLRLGRRGGAGRAWCGRRVRANEKLRQHAAEQFIRRSLHRSGHGDPAGGGVKVHHRDRVRLQRHGHLHRSGDSVVSVALLVGEARPGADAELHRGRDPAGEQRDRQGRQGGERLGRDQDARSPGEDLK